MDGNERRENLIKILNQQSEPISGGKLSKMLGVSRQVIVQDIALLRASDINILATTKGYLMYPINQSKAKRIIKVKHTTEQIEDELCTIVDNGGELLDVHVKHEIYGKIETELVIRNRQDVYDFVKKVKEEKIVPLKELTAGIHQHTIQADSEEILDRVENALLKKNYLYSE
ncbi:MAG: transcription repressor NadR [Clostridiales bacterium]|nr:transcription repressor NadR [Clostridiales bacterium]